MYTNKQIWSVSYPILLSLLAQNVINVTDTAFLGHVSEVALGASAMGGLFYICIFTIAFGFSTGSQIVIARRNGEGRYSDVGPVMIQGIMFLLLIAILMFGFTKAFGGNIMRLLVSSESIYEGTMEFLDWRIYGFFFSFVNVMFRALYIGITRTKVLTINAVVMALTNVILDYALIFGKFGFPALGIAGAAIGSSLAELVSMLFFIIYTTRRIDCARYGLNQLVSFRWTELKRIMNVSLWTMIQNAISISTWFLFFIFIEHLGERSLAITNIVRNVSSIPFMTITAFASTCSSLVSNLIGSGEARYVMPTIRQHVQLCTCIVWPVILLIACLPTYVLHIYTDMPDLVEAAVPTLWVLCSSYLFQCAGFIFFQSVSGTGDTRSAFLLEIVALTCYLIFIVTVILLLKMDVAVCWFAEHVYAGAIGLLSYLYLKKGSWQRKQI